MPAQRSKNGHEVDVNAELSQVANRFIEHAQSANTVRGYTSDWKDFAEWCHHHAATPMPATPACVANYLADIASGDGAKKNTVSRRLAAINKHHEQAGHARPGVDPKVANVMRGIRRNLDGALDQAAPLTRELLHDAVSALAGDEIQQARDRAVLCIGFAGALRRSEIVAVTVSHVTRVPKAGLELFIPASKTYQEGHGYKIGLSPTTDPVIDPVAAYEEWMSVSAIRNGHVFRGLTAKRAVRATGLSAGYVNTIVKTAVARTGVDPGPYSGHSMRSGFVTSARADGVPDHLIMQVTRHRDARTLGTYTRVEDVFANVAAWAKW